MIKKKGSHLRALFPDINPGNVLLSHLVAKAVPSALEGLTTLFGMGRGETPPLKSPRILSLEESKFAGHSVPVPSLEGVKPSVY
jgi:hypothetical protein